MPFGAAHTYMGYMREYPAGTGIHTRGLIVTLTLTYELSFYIFLFYYFQEQQQSDEEKGEDCGLKRQEGQQRHQMHQPESALVHFLAIVVVLLKG